MNKNLANALKVGLPLILAAVAYLLQVDPMSLCKGNLPTVTVNPQQLDAGTQ